MHKGARTIEIKKHLEVCTAVLKENNKTAGELARETICI